MKEPVYFYSLCEQFEIEWLTCNNSYVKEVHNERFIWKRAMISTCTTQISDRFTNVILNSVIYIIE